MKRTSKMTARVVFLVLACGLVAALATWLRPDVGAPLDSTLEQPIEADDAPLASPTSGRLPARVDEVSSVRTIGFEPVAGAGRLPLRRVSPDGQKLLSYMNRVLVEANKHPIPGDASVREEDLPKLLEAIRKTMDATDGARHEWMSATLKRASVAEREIRQAIVAHDAVPYPRVSPGRSLPRVARRFDQVSIYQPAGSADAFVIELPEEWFPAQVALLRNELDAQVSLFDTTLRSLFDSSNNDTR